MRRRLLLTKLQQPFDDLCDYVRELLDSVYGAVTTGTLRTALHTLLAEADAAGPLLVSLVDAVTVPDVRTGIAHAHQIDVLMQRVRRQHLAPLRGDARLTSLQQGALRQTEQRADQLQRFIAQIKRHLRSLGDAPTQPVFFYLPTALRTLDVALRVAPLVGEVYTDRERVLWVLSELVTNGRQFGEGVTLCAENPRDGVVWLSVESRGVIPAAERERVFAPFYQINPVAVGLGLGLTIAQAYYPSLALIEQPAADRVRFAFGVTTVAVRA